MITRNYNDCAITLFNAKNKYIPKHVDVSAIRFDNSEQLAVAIEVMCGYYEVKWSDKNEYICLMAFTKEGLDKKEKSIVKEGDYLIFDGNILFLECKEEFESKYIKL